MKKILLIFTVLIPLTLYSQELDQKKIHNINLLSPVGYWVQYDEDEDAGKGMPEGVIKISLAKNKTLNVQIVVPLMQIPAGIPQPPDIYCYLCGKGSKNGFYYNYTDIKSSYIQGLFISKNLQKIQNTKTKTKGYIYDHGGLLNPNDGKTYNSMLQVINNGKTIFARAYIGSNWDSMFSIGKSAHWKRITKQQYENVKAICGLTKNHIYPYEDKSGKIKNKKLYYKCLHYKF